MESKTRRRLTWGGISVALSLLFALPAVYTTTSCIGSGRYCQYALFGPDTENTIPRNIKRLNASLAAGGSQNASLEFSRYKSIFGKTRIQVIASSDGVSRAVVDTRTISVPDTVRTFESPTGKFAALTFADRPKDDPYKRTVSVLLYSVGPPFAIRMNDISCSIYTKQLSQINVRNVVWVPQTSNLILDLSTVCGELLVNGQFEITSRSKDYLSGERGTKVRLGFDDNLLLLSARSDAGEEAESEKKKAAEQKAKDWDACVSDLKKGIKAGSQPVRLLGYCKQYNDNELSGVRDYTYFAPSNLADEDQWPGTSCGGFSYPVIRKDGKFALVFCSPRQDSDSGFHSVEEIQFVSAGGDFGSITLQCVCHEMETSDVEIAENSIEFDLSANSSIIRFNGVDKNLPVPWTGKKELSPAVPQGRFRVALGKGLKPMRFEPVPH